MTIRLIRLVGVLCSGRILPAKGLSSVGNLQPSLINLGVSVSK
jgi:hypothetical protein